MASFKKTGAPPPKARPPATMGSFFVVEPRCKVCQHPQRREIDMMLALGWSQRETIRYWNDIISVETDGEETEYFKISSMSSHARRHLSVKDTAVRRILEKRAELEGIDVDTVEGFIMTKTGVAESLVQSGLEALHKGETVVEPKDILAAISTLVTLEEKRSVVAEEVMLREIRAFMAAVKRNVDESLWDTIYADYKAELGERPAPAIAPAAANGREDKPETTDKEDEYLGRS